MIGILPCLLSVQNSRGSDWVFPQTAAPEWCCPCIDWRFEQLSSDTLWLACCLDTKKETKNAISKAPNQDHGNNHTKQVLTLKPGVLLQRILSRFHSHKVNTNRVRARQIPLPLPRQLRGFFQTRTSVNTPQLLCTDPVSWVVWRQLEHTECAGVHGFPRRNSSSFRMCWLAR